MSIFVVGPNDGEQSGAGPIRCRILEDGSHTEHRLGLIEAMVPPGPAGPPQHLHRDHDETFIVTVGMLRFTSGPTASRSRQDPASPFPRGRRTPFEPFRRSSEVHLHAHSRPICRVLPRSEQTPGQ